MTASNTTDSTAYITTSPTGSGDGKLPSITLIRMTPPSSRPGKPPSGGCLLTRKMARWPRAASGRSGRWLAPPPSQENIIHIGYWRC